MNPSSYLKEANTANKERLLSLKRLLDSIFEKDNNQLDIHPGLQRILVNPSFKDRSDIETLVAGIPHYSVTLHFPEIIIKNLAGSSHKITDMFMKIGLDKDVVPSGGLSGMRTSITEAEWAAGYCHSHLNGTCLDFAPFCLGSGPLTLMLMAFDKDYTEDYMKAFLLNINFFLQYESIEGVPYKFMSSIGATAPVENLLPGQIGSVITTFSRAITQNLKLLNYQILPDRVAVTGTEEFEKVMGKLVGSRVIKSHSGSYTTRGQIPSAPADLGISTPFIFKKKRFTIIKINKDEQKDDGENRKDIRVLHPQITREICRRISKKATKRVAELYY